MTPERIQILNNTPGWTWTSKDSTETSESPKQSSRSRKPLPQPTETKSQTKRTPSQLEEYHKRFKVMNANTYKSTITPEEFAEYHDIADTYDAKDPVERQPIHKIANMLAKCNKPSYTAIDLGCGKNRLRYHEAVRRMTWTSVDVHAVDDTVQLADMSQLPYEDETYDVAVLGRSLWARNHMDVLAETFRILKSGGRVLVCESFRRWMVASGAGDTYTNTLLQALKDTGFDIVSEEGTSVSDDVADVFQYIVCRKA
jgi:ubiquinone/menaquinone biosynthesis C-methylase UbiE